MKSFISFALASITGFILLTGCSAAPDTSVQGGGQGEALAGDDIEASSSAVTKSANSCQFYSALRCAEAKEGGIDSVANRQKCVAQYCRGCNQRILLCAEDPATCKRQHCP